MNWTVVIVVALISVTAIICTALLVSAFTRAVPKPGEILTPSEAAKIRGRKLE